MLDKAPQRIKEGRIKQGLTQQQLGKIVHVTKQSVSKWEKGENLPEPPTMNKLADIFGFSIDYMYGRTDNPNPSKTLLDYQKETKDHIKKANEIHKKTFGLIVEELLKEAGYYNEDMNLEEKEALAKKVVEIYNMIKK